MGEKMFCTNCGNEISMAAKFCSCCGTKVLKREDEMNFTQDNDEMKEEQKNGSSVVELLDKLPEKPPVRKRVMWGFFFIAIVFVLTGYFVTALVCGIAGLLLHDKIYEKCIGGKKVLLWIGVILCFCIGVVSFEIKELDDKYISSIQESSLTAYSNEPIGDAFEKFFRDASWEYFISDDGVDVVEFTGNFYYYEEEVTAVIQFSVYEDGAFEITHLSYNNVVQNRLELVGLLKAIFGTRS